MLNSESACFVYENVKPVRFLGTEPIESYATVIGFDFEYKEELLCSM